MTRWIAISIAALGAIAGWLAGFASTEVARGAHMSIVYWTTQYPARWLPWALGGAVIAAIVAAAISATIRRNETRRRAE